MKRKLKGAYIALVLDLVVFGIAIWGLQFTSGIVSILLAVLILFELFDMYNAFRFIGVLRKAIKADNFYRSLVEKEDEE